MLRFWHAIDEAFSTPITYHPGGWEDTIPVEIKELVLLQRLAMIMNGGWETATNAEATCYLSTACHVFPLDGDWTDIYCWLVRQFKPEAFQKLNLGPEKLSRGQAAQLEGLKRDIRSKQKTRKKKPKEAVLTLQSPESTTFEGTIVIKGSPEGLSIMVGKENCDPHIQVLAPTTLEEVLEIMPGIMGAAEDKWAENPLNPAYTKPKATRQKKGAGTATAEAPAAPAAGAAASPPEAPTDELPLLEQAESDSGPEAATSSPESAESNVISDNVITSNVIGDTEADQSSDELDKPVQMEESGASLLHQSPDNEVVQTEEANNMTEEQTNVAEEESSGDAPQEFTCPSCDFSAFSEGALEGHFTAAPDHREPTAAEEEATFVISGESAVQVGEEAAAAPSEDAAELAQTEADMSLPIEVGSSSSPSTEEVKEEPEAPLTFSPGESQTVSGTTPVTEAAQAATEEPPASGGDEKKAGETAAPWVYYLKDTGKPELDGKGPFYNISDTLDALGVPKDGRGKYWHRHDRLPKEHASRIDKRKETKEE